MSAQANAAAALMREQFNDAVQYLEAITTDLTPEEAHWMPAGTALPAGALYAHLVVGIDAIVNAIIAGGPPMFAAAWAGKTGLSELPPGPDPETKGMPDWTDWSRRVKVDLPAHRAYAAAVVGAVDAFLAKLSDADLVRPLDLSGLGLGMRNVGFMLGNGVVGHIFSHAGEIACLKGMQGKKGGP
ncbi:MAG TPA: DinB family protein [Candidatus Deferrimicrobiaceae bacterium]